MRLHALSLTAFGSFAGTEKVDFDRLSDAGLFLLHGPTGAGKTTILDAVSFALFGKVSGLRTSGGGLRSDHAHGSVPTEVCLEVTIRSRRYRIMRRPRQELPKQRGTGAREHPAQATVEELVGGEWKVRATRPTEADPLLAEELHMGPEQFHQIVMLPQGDFARFLRARPEERRAVLEQLFATHRFADVEQWLKERADEAGAAIDGVTEQVRRTVAVAATIAGAEPFSGDAPVVEALDWLKERQADAEQHRQVAAAGEEAARRLHTSAKARGMAATELHERQRRYAVAGRERAMLNGQLEEHARRVAELGHARRAMPVLPLLGVATRAVADAAVADRKLDRERSALATISAGVSTVDVPTLSARVEDLIREVSAIDAVLVDEEQMLAREVELAELDRVLGDTGPELVRLTERQTLLPDESSALRAELQVARDARQRADVLAADLARVGERHDAARSRDDLDLQARKDSTGQLKLIETVRTTYERWLGLLDTQTGTRAAALAADLESGDPCPVCGGRDHPKLATTAAGLVSDDSIEAARVAQERARTTLDNGERARSELEARLAAARARSGEDTVVDLAAARAKAEGELADARTLASRCQGLEERGNALDLEAQMLTATIDALTTTLGRTRERRSVVDAGLSGIRERILSIRGEFTTLGRRREALTSERRTVDAVVDALSNTGEARRRAAVTLDEAEATAKARGFANVDQVRLAARDDSVVVGLEAAVAAHNKRVAEVDGELERPELVAAAALAPVDLAVYVEAIDTAEQNWRATAAAADAASRIVAGLELKLAEATLGLSALTPLAETSERTRQLANLANGDDKQIENRMRLSTYVLAARLEQVADAASARLCRMSDDRYTIVHTDADGDGRRKGGLGLRVVDAWTGTARETSTLSGGESFFASLALALGVADVVAAEAGGIQMETMFIDEGFGSLDDETLHGVMDVLDGLRVGGRTVGIVSHVSDLRSRVTAQIEVVKGSRGSSIRVTAG